MRFLMSFRTLCAQAEMTSKDVTELFSTDELVYLSPDASEDLDTVESGRVYILGGLVDETRRGVSLTADCITLSPLSGPLLQPTAFVRHRYPVLYALLSVVQNTKLWLLSAKPKITSGSSE
jgi:hypothetical protein